MAGVLNFTLGLETSNFLHQIGASSRGLLEFVGGVEAVGKAWEKTWAAIEQGAGFQAMASRARETVRTMYELQAGLVGVGAEGGSAAQMATRIQRALSGMTDEGENTYAVFSRLGLSMDALRGEDAARQIQSIAEALSKIDKNAQASFAQKLFGREGAGNILQIVGALNEFNEGMKESAGDAAVWDRVSKLFEKMEIQSKQIEAHFKTLWAGVAEGAAPAILDIQDQLKKINFADIGKHLGDILNEFYGAFKSGELSSVLVESFNVAFGAVLDVAPAFFDILSDIMLETFGKKGRHLARSLLGFSDVSEDDIAALPASSGGLTHTKIAANSRLTPEAKARLHAALDTSVNSQASGEAGITEGVEADRRKALDDEMAEAVKNVIKRLAEWGKGLEKYHLTMNNLAGTGELAGSGKTSAEDYGKTLPYKPQFTELEKIGLILPGLGNPLGDEFKQHQRQIMQNTASLVRIAELQTTLYGRLLLQGNQVWDHAIHQPL